MLLVARCFDINRILKANHFFYESSSMAERPTLIGINCLLRTSRESIGTVSIKIAYDEGQNITTGSCSSLLFSVCPIPISVLANFNKFHFPPVTEHIR